MTMYHRFRMFRVCCAFSALAGSALVTVADPPQWVQTSGPEGAQAVSFGRLGQTEFVGTIGGIYRSENGGQSWANSGKGLPSRPWVTCFETVGDDLFAGTRFDGLFRSKDGGHTWELANNGITQPGISTLLYHGLSQRLFCLAATVGEKGAGGDLFISEDSGDSWHPGTPPDGDAFLELATDGPHLFAGTFFGVQRSDDNGDSWQPHNTGLGGFPFVQNIDTAGGVIFIGTSSDGVYRSTDIGLSWQPANSGIAWAEGHVSTVFDVKTTANSGVFVATAAPGRFFRSIDGALTWTLVNSGLPTDSFESVFFSFGDADSAVLIGLNGGPYRSTDMGGHWAPAADGLVGTYVRHLTADGDTLLATIANVRRISRSPDGGTTWLSSSTGITPDCEARGLLSTGPSVFVGTDREGAFRSDDSAQTFKAVNTGLPQCNGTAGMQYREFDGFTNDGTATLVGCGFSTEFINGQFRTTGGGVYITTDNGAHWQEANTGLPVIIKDNFGAKRYPPVIGMGAFEGVACIGASGFGIFRSTDHGAHWAAANTGLGTCQGAFPEAVAFARLGPDIFVGAEGFGCFCACPGTGIWRSSDLGLHWEASSDGLPDGALVGDIQSDGVNLYASVQPRTGPDGTNTVYASVDGGHKWAPFGQGLEDVAAGPLAVVDGAVYAGTGGRGVWAQGSGAACYADCDGNGGLDLFDFLCFVNAFNAGEGYAECNGDGSLDLFDFLCFVNAFNVGCQ